MPSFRLTTHVFFGSSGHAELRARLREQRLLRIGILIDRGVAGIAPARQLIADFSREGFANQFVEAPLIPFEPTYDLLDSVTESVRHYGDVDAIVAIGGGSVLDLAKGVGALLRNDGPAISYRGMDLLQRPGVPVVCYPTTAGTGSEVTHTASLIDAAAGRKLGINGRHVSPFAAVLMPELTVSCPMPIAIGAGLDAVVHASEAISAKSATELSSWFGTEALVLLIGSLQRMVERPDDLEVRHTMLMGSYLAGAAMLNAGGGPASGVSYPLGVWEKVPHGLAGGIFLPFVFRYNVSRGFTGFARAAAALMPQHASESAESLSYRFVELFDNMFAYVSRGLDAAQWRRGEQARRDLIQRTLEQRIENLRLNPVEFGEQALTEMVEKVLA